MINHLKKFASLKVSAFLLVAFLILTFWGVLAQANAESAGISVADVTERFFDSYVIWVLGYVPIPSFKMLSVMSVVHLIVSMVFRMPRICGEHSICRNLGLYGMHVALLVLLVGGLLGSELKQEYNGFMVVESKSNSVVSDKLRFFFTDDSLGDTPIKLPIIADDFGVGVSAKWPYYVNYRGDVEMTANKKVVMYKAVYDPLHFIPYAFMILFLLSAFFHYAIKVRTNKNERKKEEGDFQVKIFNGDNYKPMFLLVLFLGIMGVVPVNAMFNRDSEEYFKNVNVLLSNAATPVVYNGEIRSLDAFARSFLDDLSGKVYYKYVDSDAEKCPRKISAVDVVKTIVIHPKQSAKFKFFKVLRSDVLEALHLPKDVRYVSYEEIALSRGELDIYASRNDSHPATLEMKRLYRNVNLYEILASDATYKEMAGIRHFADSSDYELPIKNVQKNIEVNANRLFGEVLYHRANLCLWSFIFVFGSCVLAAVNLVLKMRKIDIASNLLGAIGFFVLCMLFGLRIYISNRVPLANLYEIILMVALLLEGFEVGSFFFCKKRTFTLMFPITFIVVLLLFFAKFILETGDTFQAIPAILNSSIFLTIHVFTIAVGFAAMILSGVVAHLYLFRLGYSLSTKLQLSNIKRLLYVTLVFGGVFTILGTLLGGVWADFAWGRFWGFDPKECGALFVCLWAMLALHLRGMHTISECAFALFNCFNIIVTFLCWFGINLLGVGLHSYGFQNGSALWLIAFVVLDSLMIAILTKRAKKNNENVRHKILK